MRGILISTLNRTETEPNPTEIITTKHPSQGIINKVDELRKKPINMSIERSEGQRHLTISHTINTFLKISVSKGTLGIGNPAAPMEFINLATFTVEGKNHSHQMII